MFGTITARELKNNLTNLRFSIGFAVSVILTLACVVILTHDYGKELADYHRRLAMEDAFLDQYAHTNRLSVNPQKPPEQFRPWIIGIPGDADLGSFDDNPLPVLFPPLDLVFIVTVILSLLAVLFSYDAVTGERESGTLKLMMSYPVTRPSVLLGKWAGGMLSLSIPFLFSLAAGALYIVLHPSVNWNAGAWISFFLLATASILFLAVFYLLGLAVSAHSRSSSSSILSCLFLWVLLIFIIPNLSPYLAARFYPVPSVNRIEKEASRLRGVERDELGRRLSGEAREAFRRDYGPLFTQFETMDADAVRQRASSDPEFDRMVRAFREATDRAWTEANRIQREKADKLYVELRSRSAIQTAIARHIACLSPCANYVYLATDLTGTGLRSLEHFSKLREIFGRQFREYLAHKVEQAVEKDPLFHSDSFIDIGDRPRFTFEEEDPGPRFLPGLLYWGILFFFVILLFLIAWTGFLRYDIR